MLEEKDLQAIAALIDSKIEPINREIASINLTLENRVFPALETLAEGQKTILETLAPKNRVEALEDEANVALAELCAILFLKLCHFFIAKHIRAVGRVVQQSEDVEER